MALEMQKNFSDRIKNSRTYGGSDSETAQRYRHWLDPVSILDRSAKSSVKWNALDSGSLTHDYSDIGDKIQTTEQAHVEVDEEE